MKIIIATDTKFYCDENGQIYASEKMAKIVPRYFHSFGKVVLFARSFQSKPEAVLTNISDMVEKSLLFGDFRELYSSKFKKRILSEIKSSDLVIGRFEGFSAILAYKYSKKLHKPFMGEMMSDPWDGLWHHSLLGKLAAPYSYFMTKRALKYSKYALYVTNEYLQNRFPCPFESVAVSNVCIEETGREVLEQRIEKIRHLNLREISIMTTAAVYVRYKGQQFVIKAIPKLNKLGIRVKYYLAGEGSQDYLRKIAKKYKVEDQVVFLGRLSPKDVLSMIDKVDIYIQPSLQEGLPRAVIEAMSRGCPCIGAKTAGIPELISSECVFKPKSSIAISSMIQKVLDKDKLLKYAEENYLHSMLYLDSILSQRRNEYFEKIIKQEQCQK